MIVARVVVCMLAVLGLAAGRAEGQLGGMLSGVSLSVELLPSVGFGVGDFAAGDPGPAAGLGYGIEAGGTVGLGQAFALYGDYQYMSFACGECEEFGLDSQMVDAGFEAGGQLAVPFPLLGSRPWVRAGVVGHQLRFADDEADAVSDLALGFGVGGGVDLPLAGALRLSPAIRFRSYSARFDLQDFDALGTDVTYVVASVGLSFHF